MKINYMFIMMACLLVFATSCKTNDSKTNDNAGDTETVVNVPDFNADNAYGYVQAQVNFGPRVPNTEAHKACGDYLAGKLEEYGAVVTNQYADLTAFDGTILKARNIIGSYSPEKKKRVLLYAHWDTRPWADNDPDPANHRKPVLGANDGASGVGVLLEIARLINQQTPALGIDIIFFDAEDYGVPQFHNGPSPENSWALGSQYWSRFPHVDGYNARFGILLDMVGGKGATFYKERFSVQYASSVVKKIWGKARELGYNQYFVDELGTYITDDHLYVNTIAKIPSADIIPHEPYNERSNFGDFWHTVNDTMDNIDRATLKAVGQTVMEVIYREK